VEDASGIPIDSGVGNSQQLIPRWPWRKEIKMFCTVEIAKLDYDRFLYYHKLVILECDANFGDVFDGYILCNGCGNDTFMSGEPTEYLPKGRYVALLPLHLISRIRSDRDDLDLKGFTKYRKETKFYPLMGFEIEKNGELGAEIGDFDESKATTRVDYYYISD
jgi:hypothetical protein